MFICQNLSFFSVLPCWSTKQCVSFTRRYKNFCKGNQDFPYPTNNNHYLLHYVGQSLLQFCKNILHGNLELQCNSFQNAYIAKYIAIVLTYVSFQRSLSEIETDSKNWTENTVTYKEKCVPTSNTTCLFIYFFRNSTFVENFASLMFRRISIIFFFLKVFLRLCDVRVIGSSIIALLPITHQYSYTNHLKLWERCIISTGVGRLYQKDN